MKLLRGQLQHYAWGSHTALARIQGRAPSGQTEAEYWLGAHPALPSQAEHLGESEGLDTLIGDQPQWWLGTHTMRRFGPRLPFLVKLLAAEQPLSIRVHPDAEHASLRWRQRHPGYGDGTHKPELLVALTSFEVLCGFQEPSAADSVVRSLNVRELSWLWQELESGGLQPAVQRLLRMPATEVLQATAAAGSRSKLVADLASRYPGDPAALLTLLLNHFTLQPGEAVWMPAGNLHAYLSGVGLEVMAASDNVLRAGLTVKPVDVAEVLTVTRFDPLHHPVFPAINDGPGLRQWHVPVPDFTLWEADPGKADGPVRVPVTGPVIVVSLGNTLVSDEDSKVRLAAGDAAAGRAGAGPIEVHGPGRVFAATTGT